VCLIVCDLETSTVRQPRPELGGYATEKTRNLEPLARTLMDVVPPLVRVTNKMMIRLEGIKGVDQ
jgi:hypothetical protein